MVLYDNEQFLAELTKLFSKVHADGGSDSVRVTMKRYDGRKKPQPRDGSSPAPAHAELKCLVRATFGDRKLSTVVNPKDINKFHMAYSGLLKLGVDNLKKRDKKTEAATKKSKTGKKTAA